MNECYQACNKKYSVTDAGRGFCKKGCDSEEDSLFKSCRLNFYLLAKIAKKKYAKECVSKMNWEMKIQNGEVYFD